MGLRLFRLFLLIFGNGRTFACFDDILSRIELLSSQHFVSVVKFDPRPVSEIVRTGASRASSSSPSPSPAVPAGSRTAQPNRARPGCDFDSLLNSGPFARGIARGGTEVLSRWVSPLLRFLCKSELSLRQN